MKIARNLCVFCSPDLVEPLMAQIENSLSDGWTRDRALESEMLRVCKDTYFYFVRPSIAEEPAVRLEMIPQPFGATLSYIASEDKEELLSLDQYNSIRVEFYLRFVHPAATEKGLVASISSDEITIEEGFGSKAAQTLRAFSEAPDKMALRPGDRLRWLEFLISLHRRRPKTEVHRNLLPHFLLGQGWSQDAVERLLDEQEFAKELLPEYDEYLFLGGKAYATGSATEFSNTDATIIEAFGPSAAQLLKKFSLCANKSIRHPLDDRRWRTFLIAGHHGNHSNGGEQSLRDWLLSEDWSESKVGTLVSEWSFAASSCQRTK